MQQQPYYHQQVPMAPIPPIDNTTPKLVAIVSLLIALVLNLFALLPFIGVLIGIGEFFFLCVALVALFFMK